MENVLKLPQSTVVNKQVPKSSFFRHAPEGGKAAMERWLTAEFESIIWLYKLTGVTLNIADGAAVHEIDIFYCKMRGDNYSINPFCGLDKLLPRHTLFIIEYGGQFDILMHHKQAITAKGETRWECGVTELIRGIPPENLALKLEGLTMDAVYSGLLSQVSGLLATDENDYQLKTELREKIKKTEKQITDLQKKIRAERQFNRQIEMNREVKTLKEKVNELKTKINE